MATEPDRQTPERDDTDESLRVERELADQPAVAEISAVDAAADAVITRARTRADAVLAAARARMDRRTADANAEPAETAAERSRQDRAVRDERTSADDSLRDERAEQAARLAAEREETDKDLAIERDRADNAVATRDAFLGVVGHDLRNMLNTIVGFAHLIAKQSARSADDEKTLSHAERIKRAGARMDRLIGDLVDVATIDAGVLAVMPTTGDLAPVVSEAVEALDAQAIEKEISVRTEIVAPSAAFFDAARILQVLVNLISNAIKFTPAGGKVTVRVDRVNEEVRVSVSDTGVGIPADMLEAVFERFLQIATTDRRGVGLGLYISKCIVQGHGGRIWAESAPGEGTSVFFTLRVAEVTA